MKKTNLMLLLVAMCGAPSYCQAEDNVLTKKEVKQGWELLFNGKDLSEWRNFNGTELSNGWGVVNGCIQASGSGADDSGYIVTKRKFANFELCWDWKLTHGGNSGMIYHVVENPAFSVPYVTGPEYQLIDNTGWEEVNAPAKLEEWQKLGVDYAMHLPDYSKMHVNPVGEWNSSKIVFDNGHVEHWLNGKKILEFEAWTDGLASEGVICLQDHGDPASFKNVKIRPLPHKAGKTERLFNGKDLTGWEPFGDGKWSVDADGNLVTENGDKKQYGYLCTRKYYKDFDLTLEFKQASNGNSGLFFHSFIEGFNKVHGWQCEVAPKGNDTGGIYESYGRGWLQRIPDEKESVLKEGEWNTLRLRVEGNHVQTWLNGVPMSDLRDDLIGNTPGRLMLQIHDGNDIKVLWRNFKLKQL